VSGTALDGAHAADRVMWTNLVVIDHPPMRCLTYALKACEEVLVQHHLTDSAVEAFDEGVLVGLAKLDVSQRHATPLSLAHWVNASPRNSGPLSDRRTCGNP